MGVSASRNRKAPSGIMAPVLYVYWLSSPCRGVIMACRKAGIDVKYHLVDLFQKEQMEENFIKMNPDHCLPTLVDEGFTLWESRAIAKYLLEKYAPGNELYPKDLQKRALIDKMLDIDILTVSEAVAAYAIPILFKNEEGDPTRMESMLTRLNNTVFNDKPYAIGDRMTLADIFLLSSLTFCEVPGYTIPKDRFPNVVAWLARMKEGSFYSSANVEFEEYKRKIFPQYVQKAE